MSTYILKSQNCYILCTCSPGNSTFIKYVRTVKSRITEQQAKPQTYVTITSPKSEQTVCSYSRACRSRLGQLRIDF